MSYLERFHLVLSGKKKMEEKIYTHYYKISEPQDFKDSKSFQREYIYLPRKKDQIGFRHFISIAGCQKTSSNVFKSSE